MHISYARWSVSAALLLYSGSLFFLRAWAGHWWPGPYWFSFLFPRQGREPHNTGIGGGRLCSLYPNCCDLMDGGNVQALNTSFQPRDCFLSSLFLFLCPCGFIQGKFADGNWVLWIHWGCFWLIRTPCLLVRAWMLVLLSHGLVFVLIGGHFLHFCSTHSCWFSLYSFPFSLSHFLFSITEWFLIPPQRAVSEQRQNIGGISEWMSGLLFDSFWSWFSGSPCSPEIFNSLNHLPVFFCAFLFRWKIHSASALFRRPFLNNLFITNATIHHLQ